MTPSHRQIVEEKVRVHLAPSSPTSLILFYQLFVCVGYFFPPLFRFITSSCQWKNKTGLTVNHLQCNNCHDRYYLVKFVCIRTVRALFAAETFSFYTGNRTQLSLPMDARFEIRTSFANGCLEGLASSAKRDATMLEFSVFFILYRFQFNALGFFSRKVFLEAKYLGPCLNRRCSIL